MESNKLVPMELSLLFLGLVGLLQAQLDGRLELIVYG